MNPPLVSVVSPTYNYGRFVVDAVESMLTQTNISILGTSRRSLRPSSPWVSLGSASETSSRASMMSHRRGGTLYVEAQKA